MSSLEDDRDAMTTRRGGRRKSRTRPTRRPKGARRGSRRRGRRTTTSTPLTLLMTEHGRPEDLVVAETLRLPCSDYETDKMNCLNGGQCFVVLMVEGLRNPGCRCSTEWTGRQCERRQFDFDFSRSSVSDTYAVGIAFGIVFGFITLFAAVVGAATYCWFRKQLHGGSKHDRTSVVSRDPEQETAGDVTPVARPNSIGHVTLKNNTRCEAASECHDRHEHYPKDSVKSVNLVSRPQRPPSLGYVDCHDDAASVGPAVASPNHRQQQQQLHHVRHYGISYTPVDSESSPDANYCHDNAEAAAATRVESPNYHQHQGHARHFGTSYTPEPLY